MALPSGPRRWTLILCCLAQFMVILDVSIVNVALPSIREDLGFDPADLSWVVSAYTVTFAGFLLLGGRAADLIGRRTVFVFGIGLFAFASLVGGFANSPEVLVVARAFQGVGGAVVTPASLAILSTTFREGQERNRALAAWAGMGAVGGATGAILGGVLTEALSWRWILFINVPIGMAVALAALRHIQPGLPPKRQRRRDFDIGGAITVTLGLIVFVYGIVETENYGWTSARSLATFGIGAALLAAFVFIEARVARQPMVPLRVFGSRQLVGANVVVFAMGSAVFAMWFFSSLYMQEVLGYSPIEAGAAFLPMPFAIALTSQFAGRVTGRFGPGRLLVVGMSLVGTGMLLFATAPVDGSYLADFLPAGVITATGLGLSWAPVTIAAVAGSRDEEQGLASGLVNMSRQVGGSIGIAVLVALASQHTADLAGSSAPLEALNAGYHRAFAIGACFAFGGAIAAAVLLDGGLLRRRAVASTT